MKTEKTTAENSTASNLPAANEQFTQQHIPALLAKVNAEILSIKGNLPKATKTTGSLIGFGKIADIAKLDELIKAHSSVEARKEAYDKSAKKLPAGIKAPPFVVDGSSASAWITDIEARMVIVAHKTKLDKLKKVKDKLEANLSEEARLAKDLLDISNILGEE